MKSPLQSYLEGLHGQLSTLNQGEVASYIPELTKANPDWLGICIVTMDGVAYSVGDAEVPFTIQSISKAFTYATSLADRGKTYVGRKVGVEPSGDAFNSISLDPLTGAPFNPMINAGAIATTSLVGGDTPHAQWQRIEQSIGTFMGRTVHVDEAVYRSESETGHRNRAIAWMLKNFDIIEGDPMASLENYFKQCSMLVTCKDIAYMAATLANGGVHPLTGQRALPVEHVDQVLSVMATCGMYDYAGSWLTEVGMPAKSGVGGGIIAVLPGRFGIGLFSPRLDAKGNSVRGIEACKRLSKDFGLNVFRPAHDPGLVLGRVYTGADAPSRRQPSTAMSEHLRTCAHQIKYLSLQGFVGADGVEYVMRQMQHLAPDSKCFILDMHRVDGVTESAARLLNQARQGLAAEGIAVVCSRTHRRPAIMVPLRRAVDKSDHGFLCFEDNDLAVEWCENRLLADLPHKDEPAEDITHAALFKGLPENLLREMDAVSQTVTYPAGSDILVCGQEGDGRIFFIQSGEVSILLPLNDGGHQRISKLGPSMVFGEMVLLGQTKRTATVVANTEVCCHVFLDKDLESIAARDPQLKIVLLENLAKDMANKLRGSNQWVAALA